MKQNISPATAAIIAIVVVAVIALVGYKYVLGGSNKGQSSAADQTKMKTNMESYGKKMREEADKHRGGPMGGGMPGMPGGMTGQPSPGR